MLRSNRKVLQDTPLQAWRARWKANLTTPITSADLVPGVFNKLGELKQAIKQGEWPEPDPDGTWKPWVVLGALEDIAEKSAARVKPVQWFSIPDFRKGRRVKTWAAEVGVSRSRTYELIADGTIKSVKCGASRIITTDPAAYLAELAEAQ